MNNNTLTTQERVFEQFKHAVNDRRYDEVALTYFRQHQQFGWLNHVQLIEQMNIWRNMYTQGHLVVRIGEKCGKKKKILYINLRNRRNFRNSRYFRFIYF
jgi:hypothetical protein